MTAFTTFLKDSRSQPRGSTVPSLAPLPARQTAREFSAARPSPRFGVAQKGSVRAINDFKRSSINACWNAAETISPPTALFPIQVLHETAIVCQELEIELPDMHMALDDVAHAYKRCPVMQQEFCILCYWNHTKQQVVFCEQWGLPFGAMASVTGFCRLPHLLTRFARAFFATCCDHYIDDALQPDFADTGDSGQIALGTLFERVGIPFSEKKRQHPETVQEELGLVCERTHFHTAGTACVTPREERCAGIIAMLEKCASDDKLTPSKAKEIFGKLSFCLQSLFGRVGRASALPFVQRCHDGRDVHFGEDLKQITTFFKTILHRDYLPKRIYLLGQAERPPVILYTDASECPDYRGLGIVMHDMDHPSLGRFYAADMLPAVAFQALFRSWEKYHLLPRALGGTVRTTDHA